MKFTSNWPEGIKLSSYNQVSNKKNNKSGCLTNALHVPFS